MNTYKKNGKRAQVVSNKKKTKQHVKQFYNILGIMEKISKDLDPNVEYTEDNINEYVNPILGRDLDSMEKFLILGKLHYAKEAITD